MQSMANRNTSAGISDPVLDPIIKAAQEKQRALEEQARQKRESQDQLKAFSDGLRAASRFPTPRVDSHGKPVRWKRGMVRPPDLNAWVNAPVTDERWGQWADVFITAGHAIDEQGFDKAIDELMTLALEETPTDASNIEDSKQCLNYAARFLKLACEGKRDALITYIEAAHRQEFLFLHPVRGVWAWVDWFFQQFETRLTSRLGIEDPTQKRKNLSEAAAAPSNRPEVVISGIGSLTIEEQGFSIVGHAGEAFFPCPKEQALKLFDELAKAKGKPVRASVLYEKIWPPHRRRKTQAAGNNSVKTAVSNIRIALKRAYAQLNIDIPQDPLPRSSRGWKLAFMLDLPYPVYTNSSVKPA